MRTRLFSIFMLSLALAAGPALPAHAAARTPVGTIPTTTLKAPQLPPLPALPPLPSLPAVGGLSAPSTGCTSAVIPLTVPSLPTSTTTATTKAASKKTSAKHAAGKHASAKVTVPAAVPTTSTTTSAVPASTDLCGVGLQQQTLAPLTDLHGLQRYSSLASSMLDLWAKQDGTSLPAFSNQHLGSLDTLFGAGASGIDPSSFSSLSTLANVADPNATGSLDAQVQTQAAKWITQLSNLRTPKLTQPAAGKLPASSDAQAVAGLLDHSLAAMVTDFPNVFAQVRASVTMGAGATSAWQASMQRAWNTSQTSLTTGEPSPCLGTMLSVMASGNPNGSGTTSGCGGCVTAGLYLNGQTSRLFDSQATTTLPNPTDSFIPPSEWSSLQGWQKSAILSQNPQLATAGATSYASSASPLSCNSSATSQAVNVTLPGVFASLNK